MTGRWAGHLVVAGLTLVAALASCSSDDGTLLVGELDDSAKTTTRAPTTATSLPDSTAAPQPAPTTAPVPPEASEREPDLPDPYDLAEAALVDLDGFTVVEDQPELLDILDFRLGNLYDTVIRALVWDHVATGSEEVLVAAIYPHAEFRGDPSLALGIVEVIGDPDGPPEDADVAGRSVRRVFADDTWWYVWANNTHALLAAGPEAAAEAAIAQLVAANEDEYLWSPGDCLYLSPADGSYLPYAPYGEGMVVPCDGPHQFEVVYGELVGDDEDTVFSDDEITRQILTGCDRGYERHAGIPQLEGALDIIWFQPDFAEWGEGDRYGACIVFRTDESVPIVTNEPYAGAADAVRIERREGDCHRWTVLEPRLGCGEPHDFEYLGSVELSDEPGAGWPGPDDQDRVDAACREQLEAAASRMTVEGATLTVFSRSVGPHRWGLGERTVHCFAIAIDEAGTGLRITGRVSGAWKPIGESGGGITT